MAICSHRRVLYDLLSSHGLYFIEKSVKFSSYVWSQLKYFHLAIAEVCKSHAFFAKNRTLKLNDPDLVKTQKSLYDRMILCDSDECFLAGCPFL